jgi:hypothetical protein
MHGNRQQTDRQNGGLRSQKFLFGPQNGRLQWQWLTIKF